MAPLDPLSSRTLHCVIDMQRLFAEPTAWHTPALAGIVPAVTRLVSARPGDAVFARFLTPLTPEGGPGRWRRYYERWSAVTAGQVEPAIFDILPALAARAEEAATVDKTTYSAFASTAFTDLLAERAIDTLVLTGVETDICVLASVFSAVDRGFRVVIPADAVASGSAEAHAAVLTHVLPRLAEQVEITTVEAVLAAWGA